MDDPVLTRMANELREALTAAGADPNSPPSNRDWPTTRAWQEYRRLGGHVFDDPEKLMEAMVKKVKED